MDCDLEDHLGEEKRKETELHVELISHFFATCLINSLLIVMHQMVAVRLAKWMSSGDFVRLM